MQNKHDVDFPDAFFGVGWGVERREKQRKIQSGRKKMCLRFSKPSPLYFHQRRRGLHREKKNLFSWRSYPVNGIVAIWRNEEGLPGVSRCRQWAAGVSSRNWGSKTKMSVVNSSTPSCTLLHPALQSVAAKESSWEWAREERRRGDSPSPLLIYDFSREYGCCYFFPACGRERNIFYPSFHFRRGEREREREREREGEFWGEKNLVEKKTKNNWNCLPFSCLLLLFFFIFQLGDST